MVLNSLRFGFSVKLLISPLKLNESLARQSILGCRFFCFTTLRISCHFLLPAEYLLKNQLIILQRVPCVLFVAFKKMYLFLAVLGVCCCIQAFSSCGEQRLVCVAMHRLLIEVASLVVEHRLQAHELQQLRHQGSVVVSCGLQSLGSVVVHGFSFPTACGIFLDWGSNPCPLNPCPLRCRQILIQCTTGKVLLLVSIFLFVFNFFQFD